MDTLDPISLDRPEAEIAAAFGRAFQDTGFAVIADHGLPTDLLHEAWMLTRAFFAEDEAEKRAVHDPDGAGARGYTPYRTEIAKGARVHDLKEFYHIGRPDGRAHGLPANIWPADLRSGHPRGFQPVFTELYHAFDTLAVRLLRYVALYLGLERDWFGPAVAGGNSVLRLLHYPPIEAAEDGAVRAGAHEDINLITLLLGAEEAGLEIQARDGRWMAIDPPPGGLVVNVGDMLSRLTNDVLRSTTHRVVNPAGEGARRSRYSMPFFHHLRADYLIRTLPQCISDARPDAYPEPLLADDFLSQRLAEIGLKPA